ncbi:MAG: hypothetical protein WD077_09025 [Bacteroidia bacterium]
MKTPKKLIFAFIPALALFLAYLFGYQYNTVSEETYIRQGANQWIVLISFGLGFLVLWIWEALLERRKRELKLLLISFLSAFGLWCLVISQLDPGLLKSLVYFLLNPIALYCVIRGWIRSGWQNLFWNYLLGIIFFGLLVVYFFLPLLYEWDLENYHSYIVAAAIFIQVYGIYYFIFNLESDKELIAGFPSKAKKPNIKGSEFIRDSFMVYGLMIFMTFFFFAKLTTWFRYEFDRWYELFFIPELSISLIFIFWSLHVYSNLVIRRLYTIKQPITWRYFFSFWPLVNFFILIPLSNEKAAREHREALINPSDFFPFNEKETSRIFKMGLLVVTLAIYFISYVISFDESRNATDLTENQWLTWYLEWYLLAQGLLLVLMAFNRWAWIPLVLLHLTTVALKFEYIKQLSEAASFGYRYPFNGLDVFQFLVSGIIMIYVYYHVFHPIDLEVEEMRQNALTSEEAPSSHH